MEWSDFPSDRFVFCLSLPFHFDFFVAHSLGEMFEELRGDPESRVDTGNWLRDCVPITPPAPRKALCRWWSQWVSPVCSLLWSPVVPFFLCPPPFPLLSILSPLSLLIRLCLCLSLLWQFVSGRRKVAKCANWLGQRHFGEFCRLTSNIFKMTKFSGLGFFRVPCFP